MNKILNLLGLAQCAGKTISGESFCIDAIRNKTTQLVFLARDAGVNTTKRILDKAQFYQVKVINYFTSSELSKAIGKNNRMVVAICDPGFAKKIKEIGDLNGKS